MFATPSRCVPTIRSLKFRKRTLDPCTVHTTKRRKNMPYHDFGVAPMTPMPEQILPRAVAQPWVPAVSIRACFTVASCFPMDTTAPSTSVTCSAPCRRFCSKEPTCATAPHRRGGAPWGSTQGGTSDSWLIDG